MTNAGRPGAEKSEAEKPGIAATGRHTLEARDLTLAYDGRVVVEGLGIAVTPGEVTSVVGPNACGKSTLLRGLSRLLTPTSGEVLLDGQDIATLGTRRVATVLGLLPQTPTAPDGITVADLVGRGRYPHQGWLRRWTSADDDAVGEAMDATGVSDLAARPLAELSGGQRQRVWIAMALAQRTDLLLLDEPTTFLDVAHQIEVLELLSDLNHERGTTIVMVLHDLNLAVRYSDRIVAMKAGRIVAAGAPDDVVTAELVEEVFGIGSVVTTDPVTGDRMVVPHGRSRRARRNASDTEQ